MDPNTHSSALPEHLPIDMAYAPNQKPYSKRPTHTQQSSDTNEQQHNRLAQHSLSPEKLGVVGYVKDVAGFVKDVVSDRTSRSSRKSGGRRSSESSVSSSSTDNNNNHLATMTNEELANATAGRRPRHSSVGEHEIAQQRAAASSSPFAEAITGLFPGIVSSNPHASNEQQKGCMHADELRSQVMQMNEQNQVMGHDQVGGLVHK